MGNFWIGVVSREHVQIGVAGGFAMMNHGKRAPLARMRAGDGLAYYSPRTAYPDGEPCQAFTALGRVRSGEIYQVTMAKGFEPYRIDVDYLKGRDAPIKPLLEKLSFIKSTTQWGAAFRFGQIKATAADFQVICAAMKIDFAKHFAG